MVKIEQYIFETKNLSKKYKEHFALRDINMKVSKGDIYGFIGENGAGKTTLIRLLSGLTHATDGEIHFNGQKKSSSNRICLGCIIENPMLYPDMTAYQNLRVEFIQRGLKDKNRINEILEKINLIDAKDKKVKNFSLGMKQRLGIGIALIQAPNMLVLDEPTNGLDPSGILELRELLLELNHKDGITILISSHILSEVYQLASHYGFIHKGALIKQISLEELKEECKKYILLEVDLVDKSKQILTKYCDVSQVFVNGNKIKIFDDHINTGEINRTLNNHGIIVHEISIKGEGLENYYKTLISGGADA